MATSPGRSSSDNSRREFEFNYVKRLREFSKEELFSLLSKITAVAINQCAELGTDTTAFLDEESSDIRYNTAIYEDDAEDYIYGTTMQELIKISRTMSNHEAAENVRILRSARAVIYYSTIEKD